VSGGVQGDQRIQQRGRGDDRAAGRRLWLICDIGQLFRERYGISRSVASLGLDVGCPDHLGPLRDIVGDELSQFGRRHRHGAPPSSTRRAASLGSARPALISRFSVAMISGGVLLGALMLNHTLTS
jgi:hypothetical protein